MSRGMRVFALGVVIVLAVGIGAWRTRAALRARSSGTRMTDADWDQLLKMDVVGKTPPGLPSVGIAGMKKLPPASILTLAHFRMPLHLEQARYFEDTVTKLPRPVFMQMGEIGGNAYVIDGVEPSERGSDWGELLVTGVLLYIDAPSGTAAGRLGRVGCMVTNVFAGGAAEAGGLKPGDVLIDVDHTGVDAAARQAKNPCDVYIPTTLRHAPNVATVFTVLRDGELKDLTLTKNEEKFGYQSFNCPVVTAEALKLVKDVRP